MASANMQIVSTTGARDDQKILQLKGALTLQTVREFQDAMRAETAPTLILDFSGVPYVDSAGLGALVGAYVASKKLNRKLLFASVNAQVNALIVMTHVEQFFKMYPTVEEAEAAATAA